MGTLRVLHEVVVIRWPCRYFDFEKLAEVTRLATRNLNKIIDVNHYPVETAERSNKRHRPIGLGVQVCLPITRPLKGTKERMRKHRNREFG